MAIHSLLCCVLMTCPRIPYSAFEVFVEELSKTTSTSNLLNYLYAEFKRFTNNESDWHKILYDF